MSAETSDLAPLLQQWRALAVGDRKSILQRLPVDKRLSLQKVLTTSERETAEAAVRSQRFQSCSPWLGEILDACEKNGPDAALLKPAVRQALIRGHEEVAARASDEPTSPLHSFIRTAISAVKDWL